MNEDEMRDAYVKGLMKAMDDNAGNGIVKMTVELVDRIIDLIKRPEAVRPSVIVDTWCCPECGHRLEHQGKIGDNVLFDERYNYCPACGRKVDWENAEGAADGDGQAGGAGPEG